MTKKRKTILESLISSAIRWRTSAALSMCALLAGGITYVLYDYTQNLLTDRLQERLMAIVSTAATQFDPDDINAIRNRGDLEKNEMLHLVDQLNAIRDANSNIQFSYLMRRTSDPDLVEFVADADSLVPLDEWDSNEDGIIQEDEEIPLPGDPYDVSEFPVLKDEAFYAPSVDRELQYDQWGLIMAAYAPILDENEETVAIIGIDVLVDDFRQKTQATLLPFLLFILFLILLLTFLTVLLVRFHSEREAALREVDKQKDELLSIVSHQLATPVSSVKWYLEMLLDGDVGKLSDEQQEYLKTMDGVTHNLSDLVSMILDVSRIQLGRMKVDRANLDLSKFFDEVLSVIEPKAKEKGVKFVKSLPKSLPTAYLDKRLTRMTLENLLSNAVKYTPKGGEVELKVELQGNDKMNVSVKDTGCGIPTKDQEQIFGKLFRASNVQNVDGNGFGLYVAKGAVEGQGGNIKFTSKEGKGTTFEFDLPLKKKPKKK